MKHSMPAAIDHRQDSARKIVEILQSKGFTAYWAGGCVRDLLLGRLPKDYDIATDAIPEAVEKIFPKAILTGKSFAVLRVPMDNEYFEIATFRKDHSYKDGRHPESVTFSDPPGDAERRDFTINAVFYDPVSSTFLDYVEGKKDIEKNLLRCVGDPDKRFQEDYLRMLRAARFASTLHFDIETKTKKAIQKNAHMIINISAERIRDELCRIFTESTAPGQALILLDELNLLKVILPEVHALKGQQQPPEFHPEGDVFQHTTLMMDKMKHPDHLLAFSVLLHDVGKPVTAKYAHDRIRFHCHAEKGADMAVAILKRLRFPQEDTSIIAQAVRNHMRFKEVCNMREATLRKMLGSENFELELELHRLDCITSHGMLDNYEFLLEKLTEYKNKPILPASWISGNDIMSLGFSEGPKVGEWLKKAYEAQLENKFSSKEELYKWLKSEIKRASSI